jgi:gluconolactonase
MSARTASLGPTGSNGLALDPAGRLVLAQHGDRRIARLERDGSITVLADRHGGRRLNSPNDLVYAANGELYFTDPPFGLPETFSDPGRELDLQGIYRLVPQGPLTLLSAALEAPNGVALSPDERTLYVSNASVTHPTWWKFAIESDGTLGSMRLLYDGTAWTSRWKGSADGLEVDETGHVFAAGPGGVHVFTPDGRLLGSIVTGEATGNCA